MKRKLTLLNLALGLLLVLCVWQIWRIHGEAVEREAVVLGAAVEPVPPTPLPDVPPPDPVRAVNYIDIAALYLFSPDRNPNVEIDVVPPKELPPLPVAHGVMDLGSGPTAILSLPGGDPQRAYQAGEKVGDFVIARVTAKELTFQWEGGLVSRTVDELRPEQEQESVRRAAPPPPKRTAPPKTKTLGTPVKPGPSKADMGGMRGCKEGDSSPAGTVVDGYRKVVSRTPFGQVCRWEPVQ